MKTLTKTLSWMICLFLRLSSTTCNWMHERLKNGPSARLWLASNDALLREVKKRGLMKSKSIDLEVEPTEKIDDTILVVQKLKETSVPRATADVQRARKELPQANEQEVTTRALQYA